ncbi:MAG: hypothetical protein NZ769_00495 [Anaerolineae bacterium]|nr:hypothetical protein [Anaerolineae bacterium]
MDDLKRLSDECSRAWRCVPTLQMPEEPESSDPLGDASKVKRMMSLALFTKDAIISLGA